MSCRTYINLPVEDLPASKALFEKLVFSFNPDFTDQNAAGMIINDGCGYSMLLSKPFFQGFLPHKTITDASATAEVLVALQCDSREGVDALVSVIDGVTDAFVPVLIGAGLVLLIVKAIGGS